MLELVGALPGKRASKRAEVPLVVQALVKTIETTTQKYFVQSLQILVPLVLSLLIQTLPFELDGRQFASPESLEYPIGYYHHSWIVFLVVKVDIIVD